MRRPNLLLTRPNPRNPSSPMRQPNLLLTRPNPQNPWNPMRQPNLLLTRPNPRNPQNPQNPKIHPRSFHLNFRHCPSYLNCLNCPNYLNYLNYPNCPNYLKKKEWMSSRMFAAARAKNCRQPDPSAPEG
jgi:hypothetical protein